MTDARGVIAVPSLAPTRQGVDSERMPQADPFAELLAELRRLIPYGQGSAAAREMQISPSHLHGILKGTSDASAEIRSKMARYVARRGGNVTAISKSALDFPTQPADTPPHAVAGPSESLGLEVKVPTPYHAALCDLITTLPVAVVLQLIPQVVQLAQAHLPPEPPPEKK
jgi:hypothetical protein